MYANPGPNAQAFNDLLSAWHAAHPDATRIHGGGPGDVGFGPGVMPDWFGGTAKQQAAVEGVANNPNLVHGWQAEPIPQWQIIGDYPGGSGYQGGPTGPPIHQGGTGGGGYQGGFQPPGQSPPGGHPGYIGPPIHQGGGRGFGQSRLAMAAGRKPKRPQARF